MLHPVICGAEAKGLLYGMCCLKPEATSHLIALGRRWSQFFLAMLQVLDSLDETIEQAKAAKKVRPCRPSETQFCWVFVGVPDGTDIKNC